jgi:hypothetical protein
MDDLIEEIETLVGQKVRRDFSQLVSFAKTTLREPPNLVRGPRRCISARLWFLRAARRASIA